MIPAGLAKLFATEAPPELGPGPRAGVWPEKDVDRAVDEALSGAKLRPASKELVRALALLWHDHLEVAHVIAQNIETAEGSFVHGIVHRREPDYSNAKYWFRLLGEHACFGEIAAGVNKLCESHEANEPTRKLVAGGTWDPLAFVDLCEEVAGAPNAPAHILARAIQQLETKTLLEFLLREDSALVHSS